MNALDNVDARIYMDGCAACTRQRIYGQRQRVRVRARRPGHCRICSQTLRGGAGAARGHGHARHEGPRAVGGAVRERELRAAARPGRLALRHPLLHAQELPGHHHALHRVGARQGTTRHTTRPEHLLLLTLHAPLVFVLVLVLLVLRTRYEYFHSTLTSLNSLRPSFP